MVSEKEVEDFMLENFPTCPICEAERGYDVSGFSKDYVQCRSCGTKWMSSELKKCEKLTYLILWEPPKDGKGLSVQYKQKDVDFWENCLDEQGNFKDNKNIPQDYESSSGTISGTSINADDKTLRSEIIAILKTLKGDELNTLSRLGILLSGSTADAVMTRQLKALGDQNKILIMQNELILRALNRTNDNQETP